jgi:oligopeptidase B
VVEVRPMKSNFLAGTALAATLAVPASGQEAPRPKQVPHVTSVHGQQLQDPYFWMRDRTDPDTLKHLEAENRYTDAWMGRTKKLQSKLYNEMLSRVQETDERPRYRKGAYGYFTKTFKGKAYPVYCRVPWGKQEPVQTLLDLNEMAEGKEYLALGSFEVSPNGRWLAYSLDTTGYRQYKLHFLDMQTGKVSPESLERVTSVAWANDNATVFYTTEDETTKRSDRFWRHTVGGTSEQLYSEPDELFDIACGASRDDSLVLLHLFSKTSTECRFRPADASAAPLQVLRAREREHEYSADFYQGRFVIRTNLQAPLFKVVSAPINQPQQWSDLIRLPEGTQVDDFRLFPGKVAVLLRKAGVPGLGLFDPATGKLQEVAFREQVRSVSFGANEDPAYPAVRVEYESPVTPPTTYDVDLKAPKPKLVRQLPVPNYTAARYRCQRWLVKARDGVQVPVTLVYRAGMRPGKPHPMWLEAYGSYGAIDDPFFSSQQVSLLDRGVVCAYAHIRGGGELGEPWRQAGRMFQKKNTFNDFVDCAEDLQRKGWTSKDRLVICGVSAGGMLMGAVANQRPDLFKAVIAKVPFVDVINTMLDASLPLTTSEWIEWGNPNEKPAFDYMLSYSPYDNIEAKAYPSMLVKVSLNDSQVPYWEGAKYVARLREKKTDANPVFLKTNLAAGHGGSSSRYDRLRERAFDYAYALWQMGIIQ